jgi:phospholipase C
MSGYTELSRTISRTFVGFHKLLKAPIPFLAIKLIVCGVVLGFSLNLLTGCGISPAAGFKSEQGGPVPTPTPPPASAPVVTSISPTSGGTAGGTAVTISGSNFVSGATVTFANSAATSVTVVNASTITVLTPPHAAGQTSVTVANPNGQNATGGSFSYVATSQPTNPAPTVSSISPQSGTTDGGTAVTISGSNFLTGASVTFDTVAAASIDVVNASTITAITPPHTAGEVNVTVTNSDGQRAALTGVLSPLSNPGFESGATGWVLAGVGGTATVENNPASAHSGNEYVELGTSVAGDHPVLYAANPDGTSEYFPVNPGDVITWGGWGYHVSGDGKARWGIEVLDSNKANGTYISASPFNVTTSSWVNFQSTYTVPSGMAFIRFYCEIVGSSGPAVDRFDDAFLQRTMSGGGFTYVVTADPAPTLTSISPESGGTTGGTSVTLSGTNFLSGATVSFDSGAATNVSVPNASKITAVTPAHAAGVANVKVTNPDGQSATLIGTTSPLSNPGFESGAVDWVLGGSGGTAAIQNNSANAHSGNEYAQLSTSAASNHPVLYAATANNVAQYFAVNPGDVVTFGGWGYHVSGDGKARWGIEVSDTNKANAVYVSASPYNVNTQSWLNFQSSYTVPSGMAFVRLYCEIVGSSGGAVDRFDDAFLQIVFPGGGFTYIASSGGPPVIGSISPTQGISTGGDTVTISGSGFATGATVTFGGATAAATVASSTQISVVTPASTPGSADVTVTNPDGQSSTLASLLHNQSFEGGLSYWGTGGSGGTRTVGAITANAHIGTHYLEMASTGASSHPVEFASTSTGASLYIPVTTSQVVTFGGYAYRVSGGSNVRFGLEITDANKANPTYVSAPPYSAYDPLWTLEQGTYTVPAGKSFVRLYAEVAVGSTATVGRFDDAFLQVGSGNSSGFLYFPPPVVTSVSPNWGAPAGGTTRTVYGTGFRSGATVSFGNLAATGVQVVNANAIEVFAPAASAGVVGVTVRQGSANGSLQNAYTYSVPPAPPASMLAMKHIVFVLQENRSFDNYFSKMNEYRQMNGINDNAVDERNPAIGLPDVAGHLVVPYHAQTACQENLSPSWNSEHYDYDGGLMDNFLKAGNDIGYSTDDPNGTRAISYYDWTDLPYYYSLAFQFATSDRWFSPQLGPTDPNRMYYLAGTSLGWTATPHPPTGGFPNFTIFDLLDQAGISWKYYYQFAQPLHIPYWSIYQKDPSKIVPITQYFTDVANESTFPSVVFIEEGEYDEHPEPNPGTTTQTQSVQQGVTVIKSFVDALMQSPTWKTSAFILSYDEGGGYDDHVVPPAAALPDGIPPILTIGQDASGLFNQLGLRLPVIVASPWTPAHLVSHVVRDHTAVLKLIETRFGLPPLTARDAASDNMSEFFNFTTPPYLTPPTMPAQPTTDPCNLSLEVSPNQ